ncbi:MAG: hypothetical protein NZ933_05085, partial [Bacteroidia bacterium]|nr:hypothetical protein [Bacteroidia bacterium]
MRVGIFFGGASREREISYAGGRTIYDLIDRQRFKPIPLFLDFSHKIIRISPRYLYYGMITDFFPPLAWVPPNVRFPVYAEQLISPEAPGYLDGLNGLGELIPLDRLAQEIDVAFLVLHGLGGEDGSIQGLLEQLGIPYTGTSIWGSAWGMDKALQREWLAAHGFAIPRYALVERRLFWESPTLLKEKIMDQVGLPCVVKHPLQGSTIGVAVCHTEGELTEALHRCAFTWPVEWLPPYPTAGLLELTQGLGLPLLYRDEEGEPHQVIQDWKGLAHFLSQPPRKGFVEAWDAPSQLVVEAFVEGEEFSVIVIEDLRGEKVALPPTHIRKEGRLYDYRAKYLAGISSKRTPSENLPNKSIQEQAERLAEKARLSVCARLDGIASKEGAIYFNDPNTTSGMLPNSLLFHQAAEVGFTPRDFITYLINSSLKQSRTGPPTSFFRLQSLRTRSSTGAVPAYTRRIAVIFGGPSTERHISLESGRNVVEKLSSKYQVVPLFLRQVEGGLELWELPPRLLFKDNADDVARALNSQEIPEVTFRTRQRLR